MDLERQNHFEPRKASPAETPSDLNTISASFVTDVCELFGEDRSIMARKMIDDIFITISKRDADAFKTACFTLERQTFLHNPLDMTEAAKAAKIQITKHEILLLAEDAWNEDSKQDRLAA